MPATLTLREPPSQEAFDPVWARAGCRLLLGQRENRQSDDFAVPPRLLNAPTCPGHYPE